MIYKYANIKEILTMRLKDSRVVSDLGREIYAVRFVAKIGKLIEKGNKILVELTDGYDTITAVMYKRLSINVDKLGKEIIPGDSVIVYAHLEPLNKICYIDYIKKASITEELFFLAMTNLTYLFLLMRGNIGGGKEDKEG